MACAAGLPVKASMSLSLTDLNSYVAHTVPDLTFGNQHPTFAMPKTVQDYPIISVVR